MEKNLFDGHIEYVDCYDVESYFDKESSKYYLRIKYLVKMKSKIVYLTFPKVELPIKRLGTDLPDVVEEVDYSFGMDIRDMIKPVQLGVIETKPNVQKHYIHLFDPMKMASLELFPTKVGENDFCIIEEIIGL